MKLEAYFVNPKSAKEAIEKLKEKGFKVDVEEVEPRVQNVRHIFSDEANTPGLFAMATISFTDSFPSAVPMANPMFTMLVDNENGNTHYQISVNVERDNVKTAREIIEKAGGVLDRPMPKK